MNGLGLTWIALFAGTRGQTGLRFCRGFSAFCLLGRQSLVLLIASFQRRNDGLPATTSSDSRQTPSNRGNHPSSEHNTKDQQKAHNEIQSLCCSTAAIWGDMK